MLIFSKPCFWCLLDNISILGCTGLMILSCPSQKPQVFQKYFFNISNMMFLTRSSQSGVFISQRLSLVAKNKIQFLLPRTVTATGQKECESSLPVCYLAFTFILSHLVYYLLFLLHHRGRTSLRPGLSFTMGAVQHTGVLLYLRFPGTSVNKQHVLRGLQFQSTCTKVLESRAEVQKGKVLSIQSYLRN